MIETYDALAEEYAVRAAQHGAAMYDALARMEPRLRPGSRFLDIGCASGIATDFMARRGHYAVGIDNSPGMIKVARRDRGLGVYLLRDWLSWETSGWDVIQAFAFLHLFPKAEVPRLLGKLRSEVKPGGLLYCGTTVERVSREGWEGKSDYPGAPVRWRARWTPAEVMDVWLDGWEVVDISTHETNVVTRKLWLDLLLRRPG